MDGSKSRGCPLLQSTRRTFSCSPGSIGYKKPPSPAPEKTPTGTLPTLSHTTQQLCTLNTDTATSAPPSTPCCQHPNPHGPKCTPHPLGSCCLLTSTLDVSTLHHASHLKSKPTSSRQLRRRESSRSLWQLLKGPRILDIRISGN